MKQHLYRLSFLLAFAALTLTSATAQDTNPPAALTLTDCLNLALKQNPVLLKAQAELRRSHGLIVETRAAALPQLTASGQYTRVDRDSIESFPGSTGPHKNQEQPWSAKIEVSQLIYSGGKVNAALRAAKLTDQIALLTYNRAVADTVLQVRKAFYDILIAQAQVTVREQSVTLLTQQLTDNRHRFEAGTVPKFNVLRAEVELANARPPLIRAQSNLRLARETLVKLLAIDSAPRQNNFTTLRFTGDLKTEPRQFPLDEALQHAIAQRPELQQAAKQVAIAGESLRVAKAGYQPTLFVFANYGIRNTTFGEEVDQTLHGWQVGVAGTWAIFDGFQTRGRVTQALAQQTQAEIDLADTRRTIELEVRQACSDHLQSLELLEAQKKTVEQAEESLRLADARFHAGTGTQLDVLSAQTALTEARSNEIQAYYDYNVADAALERATGASVTTKN